MPNEGTENKTIIITPQQIEDNSDLYEKKELTAAESVRLDRRKRIWDKYIKRFSIKEIAASEEISIQTVYNDIKEAREEYKNCIKTQNPLDFIIEHTLYLKALQRAAADIGLQDPLLIEIDPLTGKPLPITSKDNALKLKALELMSKIEKMIIDMDLDTGMIPRDTQKLVHTFEKMTNSEVKQEAANRSPEEIQANILKLLEKGKQV